METFTFIIGIILISMSLLLLIMSNSMNTVGEILVLSLIALIIGIGGGLLLYYTFNKSGSSAPQAIDVYQGETKLMYDFHDDGTYDSIVVWKGNSK